MTFTHAKDAPEGHKWQTRDGREVRIYCTDAGGDFPIHGAVETSEGRWSCRNWTSDGKFDLVWDSQNDLIDAPRTHKVWVNVYRGRNGKLVSVGYPTEEGARAAAKPETWTVLARTCIEITEGEGLE